jgi:DEAD/DEAH box helicase domain-containing protein
MATGYFDIETKYLFQDVGGFRNCDKLGLSVACLIVDDGPPEFFEEHQAADLVDRLCEMDRVVGHNILCFDYIVLRPYVDFDIVRRLAPNTRDTLQMIYRDTKVRVSLNNLARNNLGGCKSGNGADMPRLWREGRHDEVKKYCAHDVELTKAVYLFGKENGYVRFTKYDRFDRSKSECVKLMVAW